MIPSRQEIEEIEKDLAKKLMLKRGWKVKFDVRPYMFCDCFWKVCPAEKVVLIECYSARYPATWFDWKVEVMGEIRKVLKMGGYVKAEGSAKKEVLK